MATVKDLSHGHDNNLNLLRFVAASLVLYTHAFATTGSSDPMVRLCGISAGSFAVDIFFVISGFLVTKSWYRHRSLTEYLKARCLRIYPALWVAVLVCVFVVGPAFTQIPLKEYFSSLHTAKFLLENTTLLPKGVTITLPGVFADGHSHNVNTPLWTLPYELKMYLAVAAFSLAGVTLKRWFLPLVIVASFAVFLLSGPALIDATDGALSRFVFFFFSGALMFRFAGSIPLRTHYAVAVAIIGLLAAIPADPEQRRYLLALSTPYLVMYLAFVPAGLIRQYNKLGDYSYGMYIYGFPVQQITVRLVDSHSTAINLAIAFSVTLLLAALSWHLLESRALRFRAPADIMESRRRRPASTFES